MNYLPFIGGGKDTTSEKATECGAVFNSNDTGLEFFESVRIRFIEFNDYHKEKHKILHDDVEYILQCTLTDLTTPKHLERACKRIDTYFYIYRAIQGHIEPGNKKFESLFKLKQNLFNLVTFVFKKTKGEEPNLIIEDKDHLSKMNIAQHLSSLIALNNKDVLLQFFVLCKLSMQSAKRLVTSDYRPQWIDILSKIKDVKLFLEDFVQEYVMHEKAFEQFPINTTVFIHLIQQLQLANHQKLSLFKAYVQLSILLKLNMKTFLDQFKSIYTRIVRNKQCEMSHVVQFLVWIRTIDQHVFEDYFSIYSSILTTDELWDLFFYLVKNSLVQDSLMAMLATKLNEKLLTLTVITFRKHGRVAQSHLTQIKPELLTHYKNIFGEILDNFINRQINDPNYSYRITQWDCKDFLKLSLQFSSTQHLHKSSLSLIRRILFHFDEYKRTQAQKLKILFENLKDFDINLCQQYAAEQIIKDEWLKDVVNSNLQIWLRLDRDTYQYLCDHHQNNPWTFYIWSRILNLSFSKMTSVNSNEILSKMEDWLKTMRHHIPSPDDILTAMLVYQLVDGFLLKNPRSILSLPKIPTIISFVIAMREDKSDTVDAQLINAFVQNGHDILTEILQLKSKCSLYRDLSTGSIIECFLPSLNLQAVFEQVDREYYRFPSTTEQINAIVGLPKSNFIDLNNIQSPSEFFDRFIQQMVQWLNWCERFVDIFQQIIDWMKNHNVQRSSQLLVDLLRVRDDQKMTLLEMRTIIERVLKLLQPFKDLRRLCHLFNCLVSFEVLNPGALNNQENTIKFLTELKRFQPNNFFVVDARKKQEQIISFGERQQVQWTLASEGQPCDVHVEYRIQGANTYYDTLYQKDNVAIHKNVLQGTFETQRNGQICITIDNVQNRDPRTVWYRIKSVSLSSCHLFHGIFNMQYDKYYGSSSQILSEQDLSQLLETVFGFINKLLNGDLSLRDMTELRAIFQDKNINIREEVSKLFATRSNEQPNTQGNNVANERAIAQVCEWLQIYQYYSHLNVIMDCVEKFDLLPKDNEEETIGHLKRLGGNENCSLKEITRAYQILQERFKNLTHQHLQLIKTAVECSTVIQTMKAADLYSPHGQRRFQELRDNLTTQFQLQELNNMILNSWIITYTLIKPFIFKANSFDDFVARLAELSNLEESSLNHIKVVNDNLQMVTLWLSAEETTVLDNALITMEHLYKSGSVSIYLRHLIRKTSYYEINYSIDRIQGGLRNDQDENEPIEENQAAQAKKIQFLLSMSDIEDHKRQLTFCNVDAQQNLIYKKALINGQLKLLKTVDNIYQTFTKLELAGHPDYQLRDEHYEIHLQQCKLVHY